MAGEVQKERMEAVVWGWPLNPTPSPGGRGIAWKTHQHAYPAVAAFSHMEKSTGLSYSLLLICC